MGKRECSWDVKQPLCPGMAAAPRGSGRSEPISGLSRAFRRGLWNPYRKLQLHASFCLELLNKCPHFPPLKREVSSSSQGPAASGLTAPPLRSRAVQSRPLDATYPSRWEGHLLSFHSQNLFVLPLSRENLCTFHCQTYKPQTSVTSSALLTTLLKASASNLSPLE